MVENSGRRRLRRNLAHKLRRANPGEPSEIRSCPKAAQKPSNNCRTSAPRDEAPTDVRQCSGWTLFDHVRQLAPNLAKVDPSSGNHGARAGARQTAGR